MAADSTPALLPSWIVPGGEKIRCLIASRLSIGTPLL